MHTNSIWFRAALSIAAVWIIVAGYQAYSYYGDLADAERAQRFDQSRYDECSNDKLDIDGEKMTWRPPTVAEQDTCRRGIEKVAQDLHDRRTLWDGLLNGRLAAERFFYRGVLPMSLLLLLIAYWTRLSVAGQLYVNWLKSGSRKKD